MPSYSVYTWDHDMQSWHLETTGLTLWGLRPVLRALRQLGWTTVSMLITKQD
jgi:hypothetical protein